jgi:hypothetical protein
MRIASQRSGRNVTAATAPNADGCTILVPARNTNKYRQHHHFAETATEHVRSSPGQHPLTFSRMRSDMKKLLLTACCVAFLGGVTAASAQQMSPGASSTESSMSANARMSKKKMMMKKKKMMMKKDGMSDGMGMKKM